MGNQTFKVNLNLKLKKHYLCKNYNMGVADMLFKRKKN